MSEPELRIPPEFAKHFGADPLDPELEDYVITYPDGHTCIKHPLVFSMFHIPILNRMVNNNLKGKQQMLVEYEAESNWNGYIMAHERPYRMDALMYLADKVTDEEWWELVGVVWMDSENIREYPDEWDEVLRSDRPQRHAMMDADDHAAFDELPERIDVYQGCTVVRDDGWSWSTNVATAVWFAHRFAMLEQASPVLRTGWCHKSAVTAYLTRRNENEIIVAPEYVNDVVVSDAPPSVGRR